MHRRHAGDSDGDATVGDGGRRGTVTAMPQRGSRCDGDEGDGKGDGDAMQCERDGDGEGDKQELLVMHADWLSAHRSGRTAPRSVHMTVKTTSTGTA